MRTLLLAPALAFLAFPAVLTGCAVQFNWDSPDHWVERTDQFDVGARDLDRLAVLTRNGAVRVHAEPGLDLVEVTAIVRAGGDDEEDARAALACLEVVRRTNGDTFEIADEWTRKPEMGWSSQVEFHVKAPARFGARLVSHNGEITATGFEGALDVESHNGRLELDAPARHVKATTHNGAVEYRGPAEEATIETQNGAIEATLTGGPVNGRISSNNGAIRIHAKGEVRGTIEGETHNGQISFHSVRGDCQLRDDWFKVQFADPSAGRLLVETHNGAIDLD